jgi:hypothetical protein
MNRPRPLVVAFVLTISLTACLGESASPHAGGQPASGTATPGQSDVSESAGPSETLEPTPSTTAQTYGEGSVGAEFAMVLVNRLAVRLDPGAAAGVVTCAPESAEVRLDAGDIVLVLPDPPVVDETSDWHRVVAPADDGLPAIGTTCDDVPFVVGWIATGLGEPWVTADLQCPDQPASIGELAAALAEPLLALACFESSAIAVRGSLVPPPDGEIGFACPGIEPGWLTCGIDRVTDGSSSVVVRIPPGSSLPVDIDIQLVIEVDHAAAQSCISLAEGGYSPEAVVAFCRVQLVVLP